MIAYCYNQDGVFTGIEETQESPLEPGVFLLPAQATFKEIPEYDSQLKRLVWNDQTEDWTIEDIPQEISEELEEIVANNSLSPEQEQILRTSIVDKLRNIGLTDEELTLIFGEH